MLSVRKLKIGSGIPKICGSITEEDKKSVLASADIMIQKKVDFVEWRIDFFKYIDDEEILNDTLKRLHRSLGVVPLLVTYRTKTEGGKGEKSPEDYREMLLKLSESEFVDMLDYEVFNGRNFTEDVENFIKNDILCEETKKYIDELKKNTIVVGSFHNFDYTPDKITIEAIFKMQDLLDCDMLKVAVMPKTNADVLCLMDATNEVYVHGTKKPIISISMGGIGSISRIAGESFGSAVTFASVGQASAPGQIEAVRLRGLLETLHLFRG